MSSGNLLLLETEYSFIFSCVTFMFMYLQILSMLERI